MREYHYHALERKYDLNLRVKNYLESNVRHVLSGNASNRKDIWEIHVYHFQGCTLRYTRFVRNVRAVELVELLTSSKDVLNAAVEKLTADIPGFKFAGQFVETRGNKPGLEAKMEEAKA